MKKSVRFIVILVACIALASGIYFFIKYRESHAQRDYPEIVADGVLNIVTDYNTVGYFVSGDSIIGFNHDLIELLKTQTPLKIEVFLESSLDKSIEGLHKGKYDIVIRNMPVTSELREKLGFTNPVTQNKQVLIQRKKEYNNGIEPIKSHLDLAKKTLYVPHNSPVMLRIKNLSHEIGDTIFIKQDEVYEAEQLAMRVAAKEIDYAVCDEKVAKRLSQSIPEIDYATFIGFTHLEAWAVRYNSPILLDSLNTWVQRIKVTKQYESIYNKYYK